MSSESDAHSPNSKVFWRWILDCASSGSLSETLTPSYSVLAGVISSPFPSCPSCSSEDLSEERPSVVRPPTSSPALSSSSLPLSLLISAIAIGSHHLSHVEFLGYKRWKRTTYIKLDVRGDFKTSCHYWWQDCTFFAAIVIFIIIIIIVITRRWGHLGMAATGFVILSAGEESIFVNEVFGVTLPSQILKWPIINLMINVKDRREKINMQTTFYLMRA